MPKTHVLYDNSVENDIDLYTHLREDHRMPFRDDWSDAVAAAEHENKHRQGPPPDHHAHPPTGEQLTDIE